MLNCRLNIRRSRKWFRRDYKNCTWTAMSLRIQFPQKCVGLFVTRFCRIKSEMCRMLRNMVLAVAFLFLALSSIVFFGDEYDISTLTTTISVFFTGSIPLLFLKILTTNSGIIGSAKIEMKPKIYQAVKEYGRRKNSEAVWHQIAGTRVQL